MILKVLGTQNHQTKEEIRHELRNSLTSVSLKVQMAHKLILKSPLSDAQLETVIKLLSSTHEEIGKLSKRIEKL